MEKNKKQKSFYLPVITFLYLRLLLVKLHPRLLSLQDSQSAPNKMQAPRNEYLKFFLALQIRHSLLDGRRDDDFRLRLEGPPGFG